MKLHLEDARSTDDASNSRGESGGEASSIDERTPSRDNGHHLAIVQKTPFAVSSRTVKGRVAKHAGKILHVEDFFWITRSLSDRTRPRHHSVPDVRDERNEDGREGSLRDRRCWVL